MWERETVCIQMLPSFQKSSNKHLKNHFKAELTNAHCTRNWLQNVTRFFSGENRCSTEVLRFFENYDWMIMIS